MRRTLALLAVIVVLAVGGYLLYTRANDQTPALGPTATVIRGSIDSSVDLSGAVSAKSVRWLAFGTAGTVTTVSVTVGQHVKKNQAIAQLDTTTAAAQLKAAQSGLTSAQAALKDAQDANKLRAGTVPDAQVDADQAAIDTANAQIQVANDLISASTITAPIDGTITRLNLNVGDRVAPGVPNGPTAGPQVELSDLSGLNVDAQASETDVVQVKNGQAATVTFDALDGVSIAGHVCSVAGVGTLIQDVVNYDVTVCLDGTNAALKPGLSATATVKLAHADNVLLLPNAAIQIIGGDHTVNVVLGDNRTVSAVVQIGQTNDTTTEIVSGLTEGQKVTLPAKSS
jgi:macrolide-specific efflux system membrane fusion protein